MMPRKAYRTKEEIDSILDKVGLVLAEPYDSTKSYPQTTWLLTECKTCHTQAHYRIRFIKDGTSSSEPICKVCHWRRWFSQEPNATTNARTAANYYISKIEASGDHVGAEQLKLLDPFDFLRLLSESAEKEGDVETVAVLKDFLPPDHISLSEAKSLAEEKGYELVDFLDQDKPGEELYIVKCKHCGRQSVERCGDLAWGCSCQSHPSTSSPYKKRESHLLCESQEPCLEWWAHDLNEEQLFVSAPRQSRKVVQWRCPECSFEFEAKIYEMAGNNRPSCPRCSERKMKEYHEEIERYKRTPVSDIPELLAAWDDERSPYETMVYPTGWMGMRPGDGQYRFKCENGHHPSAFPYTYLRNGCPACQAAKTREWNRERKAFLAESNPELAAEWDYQRNGKWTPENVGYDSKREVYWICSACGHKWAATPRSRRKTRGQTCPKCGKIWDSLAWEYPSLAAEWDPTNPISPWNTRPHVSLSFVPKWICSNNPNHRWQATMQSRTKGGGCPECRDSGKSKIELEHFEAARQIFGNARSGARLESKAFTYPWTVDILISYEGRNAAIEYDGAHWHGKKTETDKRKSEELLAAGYVVCRLREDDLPELDICDAHYYELRVNSLAPRPDHTINIIKSWLNGLAN